MAQTSSGCTDVVAGVDQFGRVVVAVVLERTADTEPAREPGIALADGVWMKGNASIGDGGVDVTGGIEGNSRLCCTLFRGGFLLVQDSIVLWIEDDSAVLVCLGVFLVERTVVIDEDRALDLED